MATTRILTPLEAQAIQPVVRAMHEAAARIGEGRRSSVQLETWAEAIGVQIARALGDTQDRCAAVTVIGAPCRNGPSAGSMFCWRHKGEE